MILNTTFEIVTFNITNVLKYVQNYSRILKMINNFKNI